MKYIFTIRKVSKFWRKRKKLFTGTRQTFGLETKRKRNQIIYDDICLLFLLLFILWLFCTDAGIQNVRIQYIVQMLEYRMYEYSKGGGINK
jgi:hypothetical protein